MSEVGYVDDGSGEDEVGAVAGLVADIEEDGVLLQGLDLDRVEQFLDLPSGELLEDEVVLDALRDLVADYHVVDIAADGRLELFVGENDARDVFGQSEVGRRELRLVQVADVVSGADLHHDLVVPQNPDFSGGDYQVLVSLVGRV